MTFREKRLRKRVYLKSPVRENRTPGSVGGQPGNRLSYPDERPDKKGGRKFCQYGVLHIVKHSEAKFSNGADSHGSFTRLSFAGKRKPSCVVVAGELSFRTKRISAALWSAKAAQ